MKHKNTSAQNTILIAYIGKKYEYKYATSDYYMATIYAYNYSFLLAPALLLHSNAAAWFFFLLHSKLAD